MAEKAGIDYNVVEPWGGKLTEMGNVMSAIEKALLAAIMILRTLAFIGMGGTAAMAQYLARIQPNAKKVAELCKEFGGDLKAAVAAHKQSDAEAGVPFTGS